MILSIFISCLISVFFICWLTVRGMMYYKKALKLQAFLDMAEDEDILQG